MLVLLNTPITSRQTGEPQCKEIPVHIFKLASRDMRWEQRKQRIAESYTPQAPNPVQNELSNLYNNHSSAPDYKPNELINYCESQCLNPPNFYSVQFL